MKKISVDGVVYRRALKYALRACPSDEGRTKFAHLVFLDRRVICADGRAWFVARLPEAAVFEMPVAVARESIVEILIGLDYAQKIAARHSGGFFVECEGLTTVIHYADRTIKHKFAEAKVGHIPHEWEEPVASSAPRMPLLPKLACDGPLWEVVNFWKKHDGDVTFRGDGEAHPMRADVDVDGEPVGSAFVLPANMAAWQLPPDEPLFAGGKVVGQSILDLTNKIPEMKAAPQTLKIGDLEWNVTGLGPSGTLLKSGPCDHRDTREPCSQCTEIAVAEARAARDKAVAPKKRASKKKDDAPEEAPKGKKR